MARSLEIRQSWRAIARRMQASERRLSFRPPSTARKYTLAPDRLFLVATASNRVNSLGRAIALGELLARLGTATVLAESHGATWPGAGALTDRAPLVVGTRSRLLDESDEIIRLHLRAGGRRIDVVTVKALPRSVHLGALIVERCERIVAEQRSDAAVHTIHDVDDDDEGLARAFAGRRPDNHARLTRNGMHPSQIRRTLRAIDRSGNPCLVSSYALADVLGLPRTRVTRIFHPRDSTPELHVGFLGTARRHKGLDALGRMQQLDDRVRIHVFEGVDITPLDVDRVTVHANQGPSTLAAAYQPVDCVVLPQATDSPGSALQVPAKLIDGLRFGRPVFASRTPAIEELAGPGLVAADDWSDATLHTIIDQAWQATKTDGRMDAFRAAKAHFDAFLSIDAQIAGLSGALRPSDDRDPST